jgi:predicted RNase H-like HicB family nuclease
VSIVERVSDKSVPVVVVLEEFAHEAVLRCDALLCPEETGFSIVCVNLRGVISQGETEAEAIENIQDAFRETVRYYRDANEQIPWGDVEIERTPGSRMKYLAVRI